MIPQMQRSRNLLLLAATLASTLPPERCCEAFSVGHSSSGRPRTSLFGISSEEADLNPIERERRRLLESLAAELPNPNDRSSFITKPVEEWKCLLVNPEQPPPPLTAMGRERLQTEIALLESLANSNQGVPALWDLWYNWGGPDSQQLYDAEGLILAGDVERHQAEAILCQLIDEQQQQGRYHIQWVEPLNRLAYIYYLEEKYYESRVLYEVVLSIKPWHFGARSTIVLALKAMQEPTLMWDHARKAMPALDIVNDTKDDKDIGPIMSASVTASDDNIIIESTEAEPIGEQGSGSGATLTRERWAHEMAQIAKANLLERQELASKEAFREALKVICYDDTQVEDAWQ